MIYPQNTTGNIVTRRKIFTCCHCKRPFETDQDWKRRSREGSLVCNKPGCSEKLSDTQSLRKRPYEATQEVTKAESPEKKQNIGISAEKISVEALLNREEVENTNNNARIPFERGSSSHPHLSILTSTTTNPRAFGLRSDRDDVQRGILRLRTARIADILILRTSASPRVPVETRPSDAYMLPVYDVNVIASDVLTTDIPLETPILDPIVLADLHPDINIHSTPRRFYPTGSSHIEDLHQPKSTPAYATFVPSRQGGNQDSASQETEIGDFICREDEVEDSQDTDLEPLDELDILPEYPPTYSRFFPTNQGGEGRNPLRHDREFADLIHGEDMGEDAPRKTELECLGELERMLAEIAGDARPIPLNHMGTQNYANQPMELADLVCNEREVEGGSELDYSGVFEDLDGLCDDLMEMDSLLETVDRLAGDGFDSTTGLVPAVAPHVSTEGQTNEQDDESAEFGMPFDRYPSNR